MIEVVTLYSLHDYYNEVKSLKDLFKKIIAYTWNSGASIEYKF